MKNIPRLLLAPSIIGIFGCFLPAASYVIQGEKFTNRLINSYSGSSALAVLLVFGVITLVTHLRQKKMSTSLNGLIGVYIIGFALFWLWQTLTLFNGSNTGTLASTIGATAYPREGILLVLVAGVWLLFRAIRKS